MPINALLNMNRILHQEPLKTCKLPNTISPPALIDLLDRPLYGLVALGTKVPIVLDIQVHLDQLVPGTLGQKPLVHLDRQLAIRDILTQRGADLFGNLAH